MNGDLIFEYQFKKVELERYFAWCSPRQISLIIKDAKRFETFKRGLIEYERAVCALVMYQYAIENKYIAIQNKNTIDMICESVIELFNIKVFKIESNETSFYTKAVDIIMQIDSPNNTGTPLKWVQDFIGHNKFVREGGKYESFFYLDPFNYKAYNDENGIPYKFVIPIQSSIDGKIASVASEIQNADNAIYCDSDFYYCKDIKNTDKELILYVKQYEFSM